MMDDQKVLENMRQICRQQHERIGEQGICILDLEEENRLLRLQQKELLAQVEARQGRIDDLERWCTHLQKDLDAVTERENIRREKYEMLEKRLGIFFKAARKIKQWLVG